MKKLTSNLDNDTFFSIKCTLFGGEENTISSMRTTDIAGYGWIGEKGCVDIYVL